MGIFGGYDNSGPGGVGNSQDIPQFGYGNGVRPRPPSNPLMDQYKVYNSGVQQNAEDYGNIMGGYKNFLQTAQSGGYTPQETADVRARGISPIRSIYSSANRDVDRQRSLQGGYSPNFAATKAKMAREMSDTIANKTTDVNATLAQNIAQNRLSAVPNALHGMQGLYGTTPALASTFGNQALQGAHLQNQITQGNRQNNLHAIGQIGRFN